MNYRLNRKKKLIINTDKIKAFKFYNKPLGICNDTLKNTTT